MINRDKGYKWGDREIYIICPCGNRFKTYKSQSDRGKKYCCWNCFLKYRKHESPWNKGKKASKKTREKMSKIRKQLWKEGKMSHRKKLLGDLNHSKKPEVRKKISEANSKEKHWNWKGGLSKRKYPKEFFNKLRDLIKERYNYTCWWCGCVDEKKLVVHHLDGDKSNYDLKNLITLCRSCHAYHHNGKQNRK